MNQLFVTELSKSDFEDMFRKYADRIVSQVRKELRDSRPSARVHKSAESEMESSIASPRVSYSIKHVAEMLSLSVPYLRKEVQDGNLKVRRFGKRVVVLHEDLQSYVDAAPVVEAKGLVDYAETLDSLDLEEDEITT